MAYKVIVADDYRISREFFEMLIKGAEGYELLASFDRAENAGEYALEHEVDIVVLDIFMRSGSDGITVAERIKNAKPEVRIILATSLAEAGWVDAARRIGVESFWYKEYSEEPFIEVLNRTAAGESVYPGEPIDMEFGNAKKVDLTARELDVLREMMHGYTNEEIAASLEISVNTVRAHIQNMLKKTGFKNRLALVVHAARLGVVGNQSGHRTEG